MLIDVDVFNAINDSLGHAAGDTILKAVSKRLRESCRENDFVGRLGRVEFVLVWQGMAGRDAIASRLESLLQSIVQPVTLSGQLLEPSASISCALAPRDGSSTCEILGAADMEMYQAKRQGKSSFAMFHDKLRNDAADLAAVSSLKHSPRASRSFRKTRKISPDMSYAL